MQVSTTEVAKVDTTLQKFQLSWQFNSFKYTNENFDWANMTNKGAAITAVETNGQVARLRSAGHVERMPDYQILDGW